MECVALRLCIWPLCILKEEKSAYIARGALEKEKKTCLQGFGDQSVCGATPTEGSPRGSCDIGAARSFWSFIVSVVLSCSYE